MSYRCLMNKFYKSIYTTICIPFISFSSLIAVARTSKTMLNIVVRGDILVLFLILEEMLSVFHHWEWCLLWVCRIWPLLCWGMFLLYLIFLWFLSWKDVVFCQIFFCICWDDYIKFIFHSINLMYHMYWFVDVESSLHGKAESHLIMDDHVWWSSCKRIMYDPFNVLSNSIC